MNFSTSVVVPSTAMPTCTLGVSSSENALPSNVCTDLDPATDLVEVVELVAAVAEHELRLDVDERLRRDLLVRAVLRLVVVVVELAVGARPVRRDERQQRVPGVADVHVVARRRVAGQPHGALEAALAEPGLEVMPDVLDAEPDAVDRLEEVGGELLVRGEGRTLRRLLGAGLAGAGMLCHV